MIKATQLVEYAKAMLGHQYWYGTFGQAATNTLLQAKKSQYPKYYNPNNYSIGWTCDGEKVFDCAGLLKGANWCKGDPNATPVYYAPEDKSANGLYEEATEKGPISSMPEIPGLCVRYNGHVGVYIGNGQVIEARGHDYGVVKTILSQRKWTDWFKCEFIEYEAPKTINVTVIVDGKTYNGNISEV